ncbi:MAG: biotin-dependent carboxyltransferase family protein [Gemmataceae bacterium]
MTAATLRVGTPGLHTLVVDAGRPRSRSLGVPVGGAADRFALAVANALVGNAPDAAGLEVALVGPTLTIDAPIGGAVWGVDVELTLAGRPLAVGQTFTLHPGDELRIGSVTCGVRAYLAVAGGIDAPLVLGSRSSLAPLRAGETLACHSRRIASRFVRLKDASTTAGPTVLRVLPGGQADWFPPKALAARPFRVTPASNRMGLRLAGDPLPLPAGEMVSEPVCPGTVQVTRDGGCIVLGVDGGTIGGYPRIAQVIAADLDRLGQLRPGDALRFEPVTLDEAERLDNDQSARQRTILARLRLATG